MLGRSSFGTRVGVEGGDSACVCVCESVCVKVCERERVGVRV